MPSYNQGKFIERSIVSVLEHDYDNLELIVIDGGSTDNAVDVIKKYGDRLKYWVSEKDRGQSHAINKGIEQSDGDLVSWLNSDDILLPGALKKVARCWNTIDDKKNAWIVGGCLWLTPDEKIILCGRARKFSTLKAYYNLIPAWGPSSFFAKDLITRAGGIDEDFHYMMDTELWLRFFKKFNVRNVPVDGYCWGLRLHPDAKMSGHNFKESELAKSTHPSWEQRKIENRLVAEYYGSRKQPRLLRALSLLEMRFLLSKLDTFRYKYLQLDLFPVI